MLGDGLRLFLLAELPDGPRQALDGCEKFDKAYPKEGGWAIRVRSDVLLLLGRKKEALKVLRIMPSPYVFSQDRKLFFGGFRQMANDQLSEKDWLAMAGTSGFKRCIAHWQLGLFRLAEGDRKAAKDHFQKAVNTRAIWIVDWAWSKMLLSRLQNDDKWPRWITVKQEEGKP
jgi:hypothetical protein